jgi:general secretion pathway protein J
MKGRRKPSPGGSPPDRQSGFTLLELLVSLMVLAMIMAFIPGTLRIGQRVWEKDAAIERRAALSTFRRQVEQRLAEAIPLHLRDPASGLRIAFTGGPDRLAFIASADAGPAGAGVYRFDLRRAEGGGRQPLILTQTLYRAASPGPQADNAMPALEYRSDARLIGLALRYFGSPANGETPRWQTQWPRADALPDLVEISLAVDGRAADRAVVPLRLKGR